MAVARGGDGFGRLHTLFNKFNNLHDLNCGANK